MTTTRKNTKASLVMAQNVSGNFNTYCLDKDEIAIAQVRVFKNEDNSIGYRIDAFLALDSSSQNLKKLRQTVQRAFDASTHDYLLTCV